MQRGKRVLLPRSRAGCYHARRANSCGDFASAIAARSFVRRFSKIHHTPGGRGESSLYQERRIRRFFVARARLISEGNPDERRGFISRARLETNPISGRVNLLLVKFHLQPSRIVNFSRLSLEKWNQYCCRAYSSSFLVFLYENLQLISPMWSK